MACRKAVLPDVVDSSASMTTRSSLRCAAVTACLPPRYPRPRGLSGFLPEALANQLDEEGIPANVEDYILFPVVSMRRIGQRVQIPS
jgi:hypothetical protein